MIKDGDRILLSRLSENHHWRILSNPKWDVFTKAMSQILFNTFNEYAEYSNCGSKTRMIRFKDVEEYSIEKKDVKEEWVLK